MVDSRKLIYDYLKSMKKNNVVIYKYRFDQFRKRNGKKLGLTEALKNQWDFIKEQIDEEKDPFLLDLPPDKNNYYVNVDAGHQVLVLGYRQYDYNSIQYDTGLNMSCYLLLNDGWSKTKHEYYDKIDYSYRERFLNYSVSKMYEMWVMTTCHFIGK